MKIELAIMSVLVILAGWAGSALRPRIDQVPQKKSESTMEYEGKINAVEFPEGLEWINTARPLTLKDLRGKVVVLDFWTYCCINCMHIIPDLKRLEKKYEKELVVIGVHSAKFTTEKVTENIRAAVLRYEIEHPVVNDPDMILWRQYGVRAWPTLILIDPAGKVIGHLSGEGIYEPFDERIGNLLKAFDARGLINRAPLALRLERSSAPNSLLSFPGKVLADGTGQRLFVSDSNHNRIVIASLNDYSVLDVIGNGRIGLDDGDFERATFNHPQGLALSGDLLYVADTENHAIRRVDLKGKTVATIAGNGHQARSGTGKGVGQFAVLNSPWDLVLVKRDLYIAMAGAHQIWWLDLKTLEVGPYAGSGREARIDGPLREAALAQPSGITTDGKRLYVADSEVSAIRAIDLDSPGRVETIVGLDLFEFGDRDGKGSDVRLQHPLGVTYSSGELYVADTYNNKIKRVSPDTRSAMSFIGSGQEGLVDGAGKAARLDEPAGVSIADGKLYVADTNNHLIRAADLHAGKLTAVRFKNPEMLLPRKAESAFHGELLKLKEQQIVPGEVIATIKLHLPAGYKLNAEAPSSVALKTDGKSLLIEGGDSERTVTHPQFPLSIKLQANPGPGSLQADLVLYYCKSGKESLCFFKQVRLEQPVQLRDSAPSKEVEIDYRLTMP